jgi:hypothetical protein
VLTVAVSDVSIPISSVASAMKSEGCPDYVARQGKEKGRQPRSVGAGCSAELAKQQHLGGGGG